MKNAKYGKSRKTIMNEIMKNTYEIKPLTIDRKSFKYYLNIMDKKAELDQLKRETFRMLWMMKERKTQMMASSNMPMSNINKQVVDTMMQDEQNKAMTMVQEKLKRIREMEKEISDSTSPVIKPTPSIPPPWPEQNKPAMGQVKSFKKPATSETKPITPVKKIVTPSSKPMEKKTETSTKPAESAMMWGKAIMNDGRFRNKTK